MNLRASLAAAGVLLAAGGLAAAAGPAPALPGPPLTVHLPRTIQVEAEALSLGLVAVVRADDDALLRKAADVPLGRAPQPKEEIVIDRPTILGRLASNGIPARDVQLSGADQVVVSRGDKTFPPEALAQAAEECLAQRRPGPQGCRWRLVGQPQELVAPATAAVHLVASLVPHEVTSEAKVEVAAVDAGGRRAAQTLLFRLGYVHRVAVATADLAPGDVLTPANTEIRTMMADQPPAPDWAPPYGLMAAQPLRVGTVLLPALVRSPRAAVVVHRSEKVVMRVQGAGFQVRGVGLALDDGRPGEFIKVRNLDSNRVVVARVAFDGAVEPIIDEVRK